MLISETYRAAQEHLHATTEYGTASASYAPLVAQIIDTLGIDHMLDYGAGSRLTLAKTLFSPGFIQKPKLEHLQPGQKFKYQAYDPGVPKLAAPPIPAQMVVCLDVLEHIEPEYLDNVLDDLVRLTEAVALLSIDTGPAVKVLPDGRNAHLIQQPMEWWLPKLWQRFSLQTVQRTTEHSFHVIAYAKPRAIEAVNGDKFA